MVLSINKNDIIISARLLRALLKRQDDGAAEAAEPAAAEPAAEGEVAADAGIKIMQLSIYIKLLSQT